MFTLCLFGELFVQHYGCFFMKKSLQRGFVVFKFESDSPCLFIHCSLVLALKLFLQFLLLLQNCFLKLLEALNRLSLLNFLLNFKNTRNEVWLNAYLFIIFLSGDIVPLNFQLSYYICYHVCHPLDIIEQDLSSLVEIGRKLISIAEELLVLCCKLIGMVPLLRLFTVRVDHLLVYEVVDWAMLSAIYILSSVKKFCFLIE
jgi:hypothetical protein